MINGYVDQFIEQGRLVRVLADWSPPLAGFKLYFPERHRMQPKLRALIDFLKDRRTMSKSYFDPSRDRSINVAPSDHQPVARNVR